MKQLNRNVSRATLKPTQLNANNKKLQASCYPTTRALW